MRGLTCNSELFTLVPTHYSCWLYFLIALLSALTLLIALEMPGLAATCHFLQAVHMAVLTYPWIQSILRGLFSVTLSFLSILVNTSLLYSSLLGAKDPTEVWTGDIVLSALLVPLTPPEVPAISCLCMSDFFLRAILTGVLYSGLHWNDWFFSQQWCGCIFFWAFLVCHFSNQRANFHH